MPKMSRRSNRASLPLYKSLQKTAEPRLCGLAPKPPRQSFSCRTVFPAQDFRLDDDDSSVQIIAVRDGRANLGGDRRIVNALKSRHEQLFAGFLRLRRHTLPEILNDLRVIIADQHIAVPFKQVVPFPDGGHIFLSVFIGLVFAYHDLAVANFNGMDDLIVAGHAFILIHFLSSFRFNK